MDRHLGQGRRASGWCSSSTSFSELIFAHKASASVALPTHSFTASAALGKLPAGRRHASRHRQSLSLLPGAQGWRACLWTAGACSLAASAQWRQSRPRPPRKTKPKGPAPRMSLSLEERFCKFEVGEEYMMSNMKHLLVAYSMRLRPGCQLVESAARFAAESSTNAGLNEDRWDEFIESCSAFVYAVDEKSGEVKLAFHAAVFDWNLTDGRPSMTSVLSAVLGHWDLPEFQSAEVLDILFPVGLQRLFDGPAVGAADLWRILGRDWRHGGMILGATIGPRVGLQAPGLRAACYNFWLDGDLVSTGPLHANQFGITFEACLGAAASAMRQSIAEQGGRKLFAVSIAVDDPWEMIERGRRVLQHFGPLAECCGFIVGGPILGLAGLTAARRHFPNQFLCYAGSVGAAMPATASSPQRGFSSEVHAKVARLLGASCVAVDVKNKWREGILDILQQDTSTNRHFSQAWQGMRQVMPIMTGVTCALQLPMLFEELGHSNTIVQFEGVAVRRRRSRNLPQACRLAEEAWKLWRAGALGAGGSLQDAVLEFAADNVALKDHFGTNPEEGDRLYPNWRERLPDVSEPVDSKAKRTSELPE